ncbi:MAG: 2'-5' RNA ligase family protein [Proteobacteria bacterium]|nr:2'-5' RNA ligase family protein [Pseudomonadota bacterium]
MDEASFDWFQALRARWFPPERNMVPAHLTLFHHLPGTELESVRASLRAACAETPPMSLAVQGPWSLGRGVAYRLNSPVLTAFRARLAGAFDPWLTPQDRGGFRPHVTVQNKADPAEARALLERLQHEFEPFEVIGEGVLLWRYLDGPWEAVDRLAFTGA